MAEAPEPPRKELRLALIGDPVAGSVSPIMQRAAFAAAGMHVDYRALRVKESELPSLFAGLRASLRGLNVTAPLKQAVLRMLDDIAPAAAAAGSVNTVVFSGGLARGESTDGDGFLAALRGVRESPTRKAVVIGTGGAARAVTAALLREGASVAIAGRNEDAGRRLISDVARSTRELFGARFPRRPRTGGGSSALVFTLLDSRSFPGTLDAADLLVNCTPVGDPALGGPIVPPSLLHDRLTVVDLVYRPRRTALLEAARAAGSLTVEGIEMLIEQGARSFELWTGLPAPVEVMRRAAYFALDGASGSPSASAAARGASQGRVLGCSAS
ncbi:shikimate dehydrogenase [soil metagenome]